MSKHHLSVLIPARNEFYHDIDLLYETVSNVLANTSDKTEIIAVLDGYDSSWPNQPLPINSRLTVIHHRKSIGQRAATNEAARVATGEYVMKLDAHCALDEKFDEKLLATFEPKWTVVPGQYNLQVFEWKCKKCSWTKDQSPKPPKCEKCGSRYLKQVKIWKPRDGQEGRRRAYTHSWRFDSNLDFQYFGAYGSDERYCRKHGVPFRPEAQGAIHDTMSLLGACWAMRRDRYYEIEPCDTSFGSWGDMGTEISCKTWLSGGELKVNQNTWFAHFFRVGGLGFPYPDGGRKERAKAKGRELWLNNAWPLQIYPLSWLIEKFRPLPDWHVEGNAVFQDVSRAGERFKANPFLPRGAARSTDKVLSLACSSVTHDVTTTAPSLSSAPNIVSVVGNESDMQGVTAGLIVAHNVIENGDLSTSSTGERLNQPSVHEAVRQLHPSLMFDMSVSPLVSGAGPDPAASPLVDDNSEEQGSESLAGQVSDSEKSLAHGLIIPRRKRAGILYYTCCSHDLLLEQAARANLRRSASGHEIGCVALKRTDFGDWSIVVDREKSGGTMHYQILAGLERSNADFVFLCESDVFYHPSHFDFTPDDDGVFWYNTNVWRVRYQDGHAVRTAGLQQVSGICASRRLLLDHYRKRVALIEANGGVFDTKRMAYEPGTRGKFGDEKIANWESSFPNLDITGHGNTLTVPHFSRDSFRNKKYAGGWQETDEQLPGWPKIAGRVQEWLKEMVDGDGSDNR